MDIKKLTVGELAWLEDYTGRSVATFTDKERPQTKVMIGVVYLFQKRRDPAYTVEQAEALTLEQLTEHFAGLDAASTVATYSGEVVTEGEG